MRRGRKIAAIISIGDLAFLETMKQRRDEAMREKLPTDQSGIGPAMARRLYWEVFLVEALFVAIIPAMPEDDLGQHIGGSTHSSQPNSSRGFSTASGTSRATGLPRFSVRGFLYEVNCQAGPALQWCTPPSRRSSSAASDWANHPGFDRFTGGGPHADPVQQHNG